MMSFNDLWVLQLTNAGHSNQAAENGDAGYQADESMQSGQMAAPAPHHEEHDIGELFIHQVSLRFS
jgi:hypothetical protein